MSVRIIDDARHGSRTKLVRLLRKDPDAALACNNDGAIALHFAAAHNHNDCVKELLKHRPRDQVLKDARPRADNRYRSRTALPINMAIYANNVACIEMLLEHDARSQLLHRSSFPLEYAIKNDRVDSMYALLKHCPEDQLLMRTCTGLTPLIDTLVGVNGAIAARNAAMIERILEHSPEKQLLSVCELQRPGESNLFITPMTVVWTFLPDKEDAAFIDGLKALVLRYAGDMQYNLLKRLGRELTSDANREYATRKIETGFDVPYMYCHRCSCNTNAKAKTKASLKLCGACRAVRYCSRACQAADWSDHRPLCAHVAKELKRLEFGAGESWNG